MTRLAAFRWLDTRIARLVDGPPPRCPLPRCTREPRDGRAGLCEWHYADPRAGHRLDGRGRYGNLTPKETAR